MTGWRWRKAIRPQISQMTPMKTIQTDAEDAKRGAALRFELSRLMRDRSLTAEQWEGIWRGAGAASGVWEEMTVAQLMSVSEAVRRVPTMRTGKKSA